MGTKPKRGGNKHFLGSRRQTVAVCNSGLQEGTHLNSMAEMGLAEQDIDEMPLMIVKGFPADTNFEGERRIQGPDSEIGSVELENSSIVECGRVLMRIQWNSASFPPLQEKHEPQDMEVDKNPWSGFWWPWLHRTV
ncbi:MAG: hypothetical protein Q9209_006772 [Squamulea sp. 1 TL-2023]